MGKMTFTPEMLDARDEEVNLALITGPIGDLISADIDRSIELLCEWFYETMDMDAHEYCRANNLEFWDEVTYDYRVMFDKVWKLVADVLETELDDIFGEDGPVKLSAYNPSESRPATGLFGQDREVAMFRWTIDGQKLWELAKDELGTDQITNGYGISGFIRTSDDNYWAQIKVLEALVSDDFWYTIQCAMSEDNTIEEMMSFGKLDEAMAEAA